MALIISIAYLATATTAQADKVVALKKGKPAPADGVFYTNAAHAKLVAKIQGKEAKCKAEKEYLSKKKDLEATTKLKHLQIEHTTLKKKMDLTIKTHDDQRKLLLNYAKQRDKTKWYKSPQFNFWVGFVVGAAVVGFGVWGASRLINRD